MTAEYQHVQVEQRGPALWVTLNRPAVRNAFNPAMIAELTALFTGIEADGETRVVVLAGAGAGFCAGADLTWMREMATYTHDENVADALRLATMLEAVEGCTVPVVARVHGAALGGGAGVGAACDVVVAAADARFAFSEARLGIAPAVVAPFVLRKIGPGHARALFVTAERFDAVRAERIGLVHHVAPATHLDAAVQEVVSAVTACGPAALRACKRLVADVPGMSRVAATCQAMGIVAAAVYSDADAQALHVRVADEAYPIGPAPAAQSYLNIEAIMEAAERAGADALHPGYGFLAENPALAEACREAGVTFIGPGPEAMRLLGNKIAAKRLAEQVGVPTVPGYLGGEQEDDVLLARAQEISVPLLIKAAAGGGGRGMREVRDLADLPDALAAARREARAAFGDGTLLLERLIESARHVEVQVIGDAHGTVLHLGERDCSVQRRHQKIVEEAPSPAVSAALRAEMGMAAVRVACAAGYTNAGTVEFLLAPDGSYYFLEMNARLQVEHPVTELVTGLDLVALQLRVAAGERLPFSQEDVTLRGHAVECRVYAEDPATGFLPSTGRLIVFDPPCGPGVRVDAGVAAGDEVSVHYDPLLAKLVTAGETRLQALDRAHWALRRFPVLGVTTNVAFLQRIVAHRAFRAGDLSTDFVARHLGGRAALPAP